MAKPKASSRWFPLPQHEGIQRFLGSPARYNITPAGRRSYKTETGKRRAVLKALSPPPVFGARICLCAPTRDQAKRIFWEDLKQFIPRKFMRSEPMETELKIEVVTGYNLYVVGMDKPERIEGASPLAHVLLDEYANMKESAWKAHIMPALADFKGTADFVGVPEGRNHYYKLFSRARSDRTGTWATHQWTSEEVLAADEIELAKAELDEMTYRQEFLADFVTYQGVIYYPFQSGKHVTSELPYNKNAPLHLMFDFNVNPGVAVIAQEANGIDRTMCLSEVYIPRNSRTPMVVEAILDGNEAQRGTCPGYRDHKGKVYVYGDATGGADGTAKVEGSDWDIIKKMLRAVYGDRLIMKVPKANPRERARVNSLNTRLEAMDKTVRLVVDGKRCPHLIEDLEGVLAVEGGSGQIDKTKHRDDGLTHISDALGYYVWRRFPVQGPKAFARGEVA